MTSWCYWLLRRSNIERGWAVEIKKPVHSICLHSHFYSTFTLLSLNFLTSRLFTA